MGAVPDSEVEEVWVNNSSANNNCTLPRENGLGKDKSPRRDSSESRGLEDGVYIDGWHAGGAYGLYDAVCRNGWELLAEANGLEALEYPLTCAP